MARCKTVRVHRPAAAAPVCWTARTEAEPLRIALAIVEPAGIARAAEPVTTGVPLPGGRLRTAEALWVAAPDGRATDAPPGVGLSTGRHTRPRRSSAGVGIRTDTTVTVATSAWPACAALK